VIERKPKRKAVYLVIILLVAAAFALGFLFSDWGKKEAPSQPHIPVKLKPLEQEPPPVKSPPPEKPSVKKVKSPKRVKKKKKPAARASGEGYLTVKAPKGCKVYVRSLFVGTTPLKRVKLPTGKHKVMVLHPRTGQKYRRVVPLSSGQEITLTVDFY
jgi:hypothetical protein